MQLEDFRFSIFDIFEHNADDFRPEDVWFAWLTVHVARLLRPNNIIHEWEYENIAEIMQQAAQGQRAGTQPPEIELL